MRTLSPGEFGVNLRLSVVTHKSSCDSNAGNHLMNPYQNLPSGQRTPQRLVDQFNADESLWRSWEAKRLSRRTRHLRLSRVQREILDLLDWVGGQPLQECIGFLRGDEKNGLR